MNLFTGCTNNVGRILLPLLLLVLATTVDVQAQWVEKWLNVGSLHHKYGEGGGLPEPSGGLEWPATLPGLQMQRSRAMWISATEWTDQNGETYPVKMAHIGPREIGVGQVFPQEFLLKSKFEQPKVYVDGLETFEKAVTVDEVDPSLKADRVLENVINTQTGITVKRRILAFSQGYHDNYHIMEYTLTNTGNVDDDDEAELDQTMEGVYMYSTVRHGGPAGDGFGNYDMNDVVTGGEGDDIEDYDIDFRGYFTWAGCLGNTELGQPLVQGHWKVAEGDTVGRLRSTQFSGQIALHSDKSPANSAHDPGQPSTIGWRWDADGQPRDPYDKQQLQEGFKNYVTQGVMEPHHADIVAPKSGKYSSWAERMADQTSDPGRGRNGISATWAFGPYTLGPGESVKIVTVQALDGIDTKAAFEIGQAYKEANVWNGGACGIKGPAIPYDANGNGQIDSDEQMTKNEWFLTGRDSLFNTFKRARANYKSDYKIPQSPRPPQEFRVVSGTDKIDLEWKTYKGQSPPGGFEIYRGRNSWEGAVEDGYEYELIAEVGSEERSFSDTEVTRGINYFYYIQSVGKANIDGTAMTPTGVPLKSSRFYTQTYDPAQLKRAPGSSLDEVRIVPNPYHLGADKNVRWPDVQDKIGFLELPGEATIRVYTETGELVETIEHTDGSGDEYWDLTTSSNQLIVSGVYMAHILDKKTGNETMKSFVVVR